MRHISWAVLLPVGALLGCEKPNLPGGDEMSEAPVIEQTVYIGAPAEKVWQAIVDPSAVKEYHYLPLTKVEVEVGGVLTYGGDDPPPIRCKIVELKPGRRLVHTFCFAHRPDEAPSRVTYEIKPMGEMCELTLTHDRFDGKTPTYNDVRGGWPVILSGLKTYLETGERLPWPKKESGEPSE